MTTIGHNAGAVVRVDASTRDELARIIARVEALQAERDDFVVRGPRGHEMASDQPLYWRLCETCRAHFDEIEEVEG